MGKEQWVTLKKMPKRGPVKVMSTSPAIEPVFPGTTYRPVELPKTAIVRRSAVVLVMALQFPVESLLLLLHRVMQMQSAPGPHLRETAPESRPPDMGWDCFTPQARHYWRKSNKRGELVHPLPE